MKINKFLFLAKLNFKMLKLLLVLLSFKQTASKPNKNLSLARWHVRSIVLLLGFKFNLKK